MDDDPPDPFSPDAHQALPGDVVTPRTASARRALRDHELVLRAHESGTGEYRKMLVDAEQGMEKLLEMNRALRKELELERRAGGSAGGIGTHSNGTQTAVLAATLEDTRARLRETEVQLDMVTASFEALKRERVDATTVLQSNASVRKALDAERLQLENVRSDLRRSRDEVAVEARKVRSEAAQHRAALNLKIVSRMTPEDDAMIAAASLAALSGLETKLSELEGFAAARVADAPDNGGANRPGLEHAVAAEVIDARGTRDEAARLRDVNKTLRDQIRTLAVDLEMSRASEAAAVESARSARDFARAEDEVREAVKVNRPEVDALRLELARANDAVRRSEAHALVASRRSREADELELALGEREAEIRALRREVAERVTAGEETHAREREETHARPVAALPSPSPRKRDARESSFARGSERAQGSGGGVPGSSPSRSPRPRGWAVNDETVIEDTAESREFFDSDEDSDPSTYVPDHDLDPRVALEELKIHRRARRAVRRLRRWEPGLDIVPVPDDDDGGRDPTRSSPTRSVYRPDSTRPPHRSVGARSSPVKTPFRPAGVAGLGTALSGAIGAARLALADAERELTEAHEKRLSARRQKESVARLYLGRRSEAKTTKPPPWAAQRRP